jgi:hypothetical protein
MFKNKTVIIIIATLVISIITLIVWVQTITTKQLEKNNLIASQNTTSESLAKTIIDSLKTKEYSTFNFLHCLPEDEFEQSGDYNRYLDIFKQRASNYDFQNSIILSTQDNEIVITGPLRRDNTQAPDIKFSVKNQLLASNSIRTLAHKCFMVDTKWGQ